MRISLRPISFAIALVAAALLGRPATAQSVCAVPGDFTSIGDALAQSGCRVIELTVAAYHEAVDIDRDVEIRGRGAGQTVLYGTDTSGNTFGQSVVTVHENTTVTLSDLAIRDGRAPNGGGITNDGGQLTLLRCTIENNEATDVIGEGGGILNRSGGGLVLFESTVRNNKARLNGGGISSSGLAVPILSDPETRQNLADAYNKLLSVSVPSINPFPTPSSLVAIGEAFYAVSKEVVGAVYNLLDKGLGNLIDGSVPANRSQTDLIELGLTALTIADSVIEDNVVDAGAASVWGGGIHSDQAVVLIERTRIAGNRASARVGAFGGGVSAGLSLVLIRNSEIVDNHAESQVVVAGGGAIWNLAGALEVSDSRLEGNSATSYFLNNGGAIHNMGGLARVFRSTLERNESGNGGGIANQYAASLTVEDSSIRFNKIDGLISAFGAGIKNEKGSSAVIRRTAITNNLGFGRTKGGGIYNESEAETYETTIGGQKVFLPLWNTSRVTVENSTISGNVIDGRKSVAAAFSEDDCYQQLNYAITYYPSLWEQAYAQYEDCKVNGFGETVTFSLSARGAGIYTGSQSLGLVYTTVRNSTIAFNKAVGDEAFGGGLYMTLASGVNILRGGLIADTDVESSVVSNNEPEDCDEYDFSASTDFDASRANLDSDGTCRAMDSDFSTGNAQLLPLGRYGGPTVTHPFSTTSPAKDATSGCPTTDQRGESRALGGICDIGAFELTPPRGVDDAYSAEEDRPLSVSGEDGVLANDMGFQLGAARVVTSPRHGSLDLQANGDFVYTPAPDFFGTDGFSYMATDLTGTDIGPVQVDLNVAGRLDVLSIDPSPERIGADRRPTFTLTFDDPMTTEGVVGRVYLYGDRSEISPRLSLPAANLAVSGNELRITPSYSFAPGERITLVLSSLLTSQFGVRLSDPLVVQSVVATDGGGGGFEVRQLGSFIGQRVALGDLDGDGDLDAVISEDFINIRTRVWLNNGNGFSSHQELTFLHRYRGNKAFRASDIALGDLDGDGDLDILATTADIDQFVLRFPNTERLNTHTRSWFNDGHGNFTESGQDFVSGTSISPSSPILQTSSGQQALWTDSAAHRGVALGDLDSDGDLDAFLVAGTGNSGLGNDVNGLGRGEGARWDSVWFNDGSGVFQRGESVGFDYGEAVALGDADGDGDLDAFVANFPGVSKLWINNGLGNFTSALQFPYATDVDVGDFNGDGHLDVVFAPSGVWLGDGAGNFAPATVQPPGTFLYRVATGDFDADGDLDIYAAKGLRWEYRDVRGGRDQVWINDGLGNFTANRQLFPETFSADAATGDIDRDGLLDIFVLKIGTIGENDDGLLPDAATAAPAEILFGLEPPKTSPDNYSVSEDGVLTRTGGTGVLANDDAPGARARHPWRIDTYRAPSGTLGALWLLLWDAGIPFQEVEFDHDGSWFATRFVEIGKPEHGTVILADDGGFTYTPDPDFFGVDTFRYYAEAPAADSDPAETVTIQVNGINDPPVGVDDSYAFQAGGVTVDAAHGVLANDVDVDGDALQATLATQARRGTVALNANGSFSYIPGANPTGGDVFFYRAEDPSNTQSSITRVKIGNTAPSGQNRQYAPNPDGSLQATAANGLANGATDPEDDPLTVVITVPPRHGVVQVQPDGSFVYTPGASWPGSDVFVYVLSDGTTTSPPIRVKIGNTAPVARNDRYNAGRNQPLSIAAPGLLANDTDVDGDALNASLVTPPASGSLQLDSDGSFVYTPANGFLGEVTFTYALSDGIASSNATVTIGVFSALNVVTQSPPANAIDAAPDTDVAIEFDLTLKAATVDGRVLVSGAQTGPRAVGLTTSGKVATANPAGDFLPGERVTVTALEGIEGGTDSRLPRGHSWRFDVATAAASGQLEDSGQSLGNTIAKAIALGDFDGDDDLDAFVVSGLGGTSGIWRNDGNGVFSSAQDFSGRWGSDVALGDLDGDGDLDAFIASISNGSIPVFNEGGVLDWPAFIQTSDSVVANGTIVELADLDGDGDLDAVLGTTDTSIEIALNDGDGHFATTAQLDAGEVRGLNLADMNGDGIFDLVVGNTDGLRAWLGDGAGSFSTEVLVTTQDPEPDYVTALDVGDLDGDGDLDVFAGGFRRRIYFNDGDGTLREGTTTYTGLTTAVVLGDLDGDGDLDAFATTGYKLDDGPRPYGVFLNDGSGAFSEAPKAPTHNGRSYAAALGDLDGDGDLDALVGTEGDGGFSPTPDRVLLNRTTATAGADGRFVDSEQRLGDGASLDATLADFDGDGDLDAYVVNDFLDFTNFDVDELWLNDGSGSFSASPFGVPSQRSYAAGIGDLDGDDDPDLILVGIPTNIYRNDGSGNFSLVGSGLNGAFGGKVYLADLDGDTDLDAIQLRQNNESMFTLWSNDGSGGFTLSATLIRPPQALDPNAPPASVWEAVAFDADDDGDLDIWSTALGAEHTLWRNDGTGQFPVEDADTYPRDFRGDVTAGDVDGDGDIDVLLASISTGAQVRLNDGDGVFSVGQTFPNRTAADFVKLVDVNADGILDAVFGRRTPERTEVWINDGSGLFTLDEGNIGTSYSGSVAFGDLDGDGDADAFATQGGNVNFVKVQLPNEVWINTTLDPGLAISGTRPTLAGDDEIVAPFATAQVTAPAGETPSLRIEVDTSSVGSLTNASLAAGGFVDQGAGVWTLDGVGATAMTAALRNLRFAPVENRAPVGTQESVGFTLRLATDNEVQEDSSTIVTIESINDIPAAGPPQSFQVLERGELNVAAPALLSGASDADFGDTLHVELLQEPAAGELGITPDGSFIFAAGNAAPGSVGFTYVVSDGRTSSLPVTSTITIGDVNEAPLGVPDAYSVDEDGELVIAPPGVLANDSDPDGNPIQAVLLGVTYGSVTLNPNGGFTYTPAENFVGVDTLQYVANDGQRNSSVVEVSITVRPVNDAPVAVGDAFNTTADTALAIAAPGVLANDLDADEGDVLQALVVQQPSRGSLTLGFDGAVQYVPEKSFHGTVEFTYRASDGSASSDPVTVTLVVGQPEGRVAGEADVYYVDSDDVLEVPAPGVLGNDADPDGGALQATLVSGPNNGSLELQADGSFRFTPNPDFEGADIFFYSSQSATRSSDPVAVLVVVERPNTVPSAVDDTYAVERDTPLQVAAPGVLENDNDAENDPLTVEVVEAPAHGDLELNPDGSFTYTPDTGYAGPDSFRYRASDGRGFSEPVEVTLLVAACGDGILQGVEQCDDGGVDDGDGCSSECELEPGMTLAGSGALAGNCAHHWLLTPTLPRGSRVVCRDGDATCDAGPAGDGVCEFRLAMCFNVDEARGACRAGDIEEVRLLLPRERAGSADDAAVRLALEEALTDVGARSSGECAGRTRGRTCSANAQCDSASGRGDGRCDYVALFEPRLDLPNQCTATRSISVPTQQVGRRTIRGMQRLRVQAIHVDEEGRVRRDIDTLTLICEP